MRYIRTLLLLVLCTTLQAYADEVPTIDPQATFTTDEGEETGTSYSGSAPLTVVFHANAENVGMYTPHYEWRFTKEGETQPYLVRYEEETEYTFTEAGSHRIVLYATFINGNDTVAYTKDYWQDAQPDNPYRYRRASSRCPMPSLPNGDGINDIYRAKNSYQSIVESTPTSSTAGDQKIYEWHDPAGGWDGKFNGKDVKQGVYFVLVKAKGADGRKYNIKKDVNLLRGYTESNGVNPTE